MECYIGNKRSFGGEMLFINGAEDSFLQDIRDSGVRIRSSQKGVWIMVEEIFNSKNNKITQILIDLIEEKCNYEIKMDYE